MRRVPAPSATLAARHILPCPRARPALCRLTLCYPPPQAVLTSRRGIGGTMSGHESVGWGARWVA
eukprot:5260566-Prymnesium_polylepis.1